MKPRKPHRAWLAELPPRPAERVVLTPKGHALLNQQQRARGLRNVPRFMLRNKPGRR